MNSQSNPLKSKLSELSENKNITIDNYGGWIDLFGYGTASNPMTCKADNRYYGSGYEDLSEEEYKAGMDSYATYYGYTDSAEFENAIGKEAIVDQLLMDKATAFIYDNAVAK